MSNEVDSGPVYLGGGLFHFLGAGTGVEGAECQDALPELVKEALTLQRPAVVCVDPTVGHTQEFATRHLGGFVRYEEEVPPLKCPVAVFRTDLGSGDVTVEEPLPAIYCKQKELAAPVSDRREVRKPPRDTFAEATTSQIAALGRLMAKPETRHALERYGAAVRETGELTASVLEQMVRSLLQQIGKPVAVGVLGHETFEAARFVEAEPDIPAPTKSEPMPLRALRAPRTQRIGVFF